MPTKAEFERENAKLQKELKRLKDIENFATSKAESELIFVRDELERVKVRSAEKLSEMKSRWLAEYNRHQKLLLYVRVSSMPDDELGFLAQDFKPLLKNND